jgi:hypothetical protein
MLRRELRKTGSVPGEGPSLWPALQQNGIDMNGIIYIVGLVVVVIVILGFFGLR